MKGGYVMINLTSSRLFKEINEAMTLDKPYLIYGDDIPYFADSITYDADTTTYTIAKGGQLIVIDSENNITKTGDKDGALLSSIVDDAGNKRFGEWDLTTQEVTGVTYEYAKASLSGTHLMIVLFGTLASGNGLSGNTLATITFADYITDKIYPILTTVVSRITGSFYDVDTGTVRTCDMTLRKNLSTGELSIQTSTLASVEHNNAFRLQFDLLIDTE